MAKTVTEPQSAEMREGNRVHKALELRVKDKKPLIGDDVKFEPLVARLEQAAAGGRILAEQKMALNASYRSTGYFAKDVWVRSITDITILKGKNAWVGDYKTGNPKENSAQLRLTAACTFATFPEVERVANTFIWLKPNTVSPPEVFTRENVHEIWQEFAPRVQRLEIAIAENKWLKNPSGLCRRHCPCITCEHNGRRG